jgi:putative ABC transport system substrate-binding protein
MTIASLLVVVISSLLTAPPTVEAQPTGATVQTVGVLTPHDHYRDREYPAFLETLGALGWERDRNLRLVLRSAEGKLDRLPALARDLVTARVDVIVAINTPGSAAAVQATNQILIVMALVGDPVATGFVSNLARPGRNVTGISGLKVGIQFFPVRASGELPETFKSIAAWRADAALWLSGQSQALQPAAVKLATTHRLPVMGTHRAVVERGGLMSYAPDDVEMFRRAASYVDRILRGSRPGDLPAELPTKFVLAINVWAARALGVNIPQSLWVQADQVIE